MPSKKSNPSKTRLAQWKAETGCSEPKLAGIARELALALGTRDRVLLEGPMGAGKSTFARALLLGLGVLQPPEGSPTFAIAHEYRAPRGDVAHIDLYRLKSEAEIEDAGIGAYLWEREMVAIIEWTSLFPEFEKSILDSGGSDARVWRVDLAFGETPELRDVTIRKI